MVSRAGLILSAVLVGALSVPARIGTNALAHQEYATQQRWQQQTLLTASDARIGDHLGGPVALDGSTALVGAWNRHSGTGAAYVFTEQHGRWTEQAELTAAGGKPGDWFGSTVALDGDTAVVGAPRAAGTGAAYIFIRQGRHWMQQDRITANDSAPADWFGRTVALSANTLVVGAWYKHDDLGAAYVFVRHGSHWTQQAELSAGDAKEGDYFGTAVALNMDTALVGAAGADDTAGTAYVFERHGSSWSQQAELHASDGQCCAAFGAAVAVDGDQVVVGAPQARGGSGEAYVFVRQNGGWRQQTELRAGDGKPGDWFGWTVTVKGDTALIGAWYKLGATGAAYAFAHGGNGWRQQAELRATDGRSGDSFGSSVALSGSVGLVGAGFRDHATGAVYVFALPPTL